MITFKNIIEEELNNERKSLSLIEKNPSYILNIDKPTDNELNLAFMLDARLAEKFENIPENIQFNMVEKNVDNVKYIKNPTTDIQIFCIEKDPESFHLLKKHNAKSFMVAHPFIFL
jgi:hypothetical protein